MAIKKTTPRRKTAPATAVKAPATTAKPAKVAGPMIRRKELVERIVARSGLKPNAVKSALDAVLEEMGKALSAGEGMNIHPFGKVTINRQKVQGDKEIIICKVRRKLSVSNAPQSFDTAAE